VSDMTHDEDAFPVVVIGAGLAGLSAALHLAHGGVPPLLIEADSEWPGGCLAGGEAETFEYAGQMWSFSTEHGAHALWGGYDNMRAMLTNFLGLEFRESEGEEWINRWGNEVRYLESGTAVRDTWLPAPFHYVQLILRPQFWTTINLFDLLSLPGFLVSILMTVGFDPIKEGVELKGLTIDDYFTGWTPNMKATFRGLGHSLLAAPSEEIGLSGFIAALRFFTMLRRDTWHLSYLPENANDCIIQPIIAQVEEREGMYMGGVRATGLIRDGDYWQIEVEDARRGRRTMLARHVILAVDPPAAQDILTNQPDTGAQAANMHFPKSLRSSTARLWFDESPRYGSPGGMFTGDFAIDNFFWLHKLHGEFAPWHEATDGSAIEVHFYAPDDVQDQTDELLLILAANEVQKAFPRLRGHFVHGGIRRNGRTMTRFEVPTTESLHVETPWPGVFACGDWIGHESTAMWMERSTVTGIAAANAVLHANGLPPYPIIPSRKPEPLARGLGALVYGGRKVFGPPIRALVRLLKGGRR
jgi:isorenieratene synthase